MIVVDGDAPVRALIARALTTDGYAVTQADSAEVALIGVASSESPLLVVDAALPGMSGLDMIEELRKVRDDFECVLITELEDVAMLERSLRVGLFRCLPKPFAIDDLFAAVAGAANRLFLRLDLRERKAELERRNHELEDSLVRLREAEQQRALSERLASIGQFAAALAHEINNPLAYVEANFDLIREGVLQSLQALHVVATGGRYADLAEDARRKLDVLALDLPTIIEETATGIDLIHQISRDLNRVSRYRTDRPEVFDANEVVATACRVARIDSRLRAKLTLDLVRAKLPVRGSTGRIAQVVMNLVANAIAATDEAAARPNVVSVRTREDGDAIELEVTDTGRGIPRDRLTSIFKPFVTFRAGEGTGIGLALVQQIVREHDGSISVESEVGRGTTFRVRLPLAESAVTESQRALASGPLQKLPSGMRLLFVDDDEMLRRTYARVFGAHEVWLARDGREAIERLERERPDAIVCDLYMPEQDGISFYEQVEARWPALARRLVFVSGSDSLARRAASLGRRVPIVRKPFVAADLEASLLRVITANDAS